jgi:hypothetical protein
MLETVDVRDHTSCIVQFFSIFPEIGFTSTRTRGENRLYLAATAGSLDALKELILSLGCDAILENSVGKTVLELVAPIQYSLPAIPETSRTRDSVRLLALYFSTPRLSDVSLSPREGTQIFAYREILFAQSSYFKSTLDNDSSIEWKKPLDSRIVIEVTSGRL